MPDFLLELRSEEIPARMQAKACEDLARLIGGELAKAGLTATKTITYATPRRLALIAKDLPTETAAVSEEVKGPRSSAPPQALDGFLRKTGLAQDALVERDGVYFAVIEKPGRATADVLAEAIPAIVRAFPWPKSMRWGAASLSTESPRWVRPLQGIVALFDDAVVLCEVAGVTSGATTVGHRFHHPAEVTIAGADAYVETLRDAHVIVDQAEREAIIAMGATMLTAKAGLTLIRDEGLLAENAGLTEWPVPLLGRFDAEYLSVPPEVIQLTARVNQKYFVCNDAEGKLANAFVCVANIDAADGGAKIVEGNRKVLAARLSDARFFYETDLKTRLEDLTPKLEKIVFHEKLGTVADKVERVAKLARWLVGQHIVTPAEAGVSGNGAGQVSHETPAFAGVTELADLAERAARLAKADLVTGMVGEFPELQGVMGGYYAAAQGEDPAVAAAIRDHYKPVGQGDDVPTAPVTVAVSLADKLDTIASFFVAGIMPTGSRDPFALRRSSMGIIELYLCNALRGALGDALANAARPIAEKLARAEFISSDRLFSVVANAGDKAIARTAPSYEENIDFRGEMSDAIEAEIENATAGKIVQTRLLLLDFFADRLKVQQREAGVRHDLIDAVFALGGEDDLVRLLARVHALQAFVGTDDGANLLAGYKRAANILKKEGYAPADTTRHPGLVPGSTEPQDTAGRQEEWTPEQVRGDGGSGAGGTHYTPEPAEAALLAALDAAEPRARDAVAAEDFAGAMAALASLRAPIDAFFESVTVNDPDPAKREARLNLLARVRTAVHSVADFSKIEG